MSARSNSRSSRSCTISMCSRPRNPHRKPKPSAAELSGSIGQRGVVELELDQRVAQRCVLLGVGRKQAAEDHRLDLAIAGQRLSTPGLDGIGNRVPYPRVADSLHARREVADLTGAKRIRRRPCPA